MDLTLLWRGPFSFSSRVGKSLLQSPEGRQAGIYVWGVPTKAGLLPHYVGESSQAMGRRHFEHFQAYASGIYSVCDAEEFAHGNEVVVHKGPLWRKDAWSHTQQFIDRFAEFAQHIDRILAAIQVFVAPLDADQRTRRRVETGLVRAFYLLPEAKRSLFSAGYRTWNRRADEETIAVICDSTPPIEGFPERLEA